MKKLFCALAIILSVLLGGQELNYPITGNEPIVDAFYNMVLTDSYRWLENLDDEKVLKWVDQQNSIIIESRAERRTLRSYKQLQIQA